MIEEKVSCNQCNAQILISTAKKCNGICMKCVKINEENIKKYKNPKFRNWLKKIRENISKIVFEEIKTSVLNLYAKGEDFYGYALLPSNYWTSSNPINLYFSYNKDSDIEENNIFDPYYRYCVDSWSNYIPSGFEKSNIEFNLAYLAFKKIVISIERDEDVEDVLDEYIDIYIKGIHGLILEALKAIKHENIFRNEVYLVIWIDDSNDEITLKSAKELNSTEIYKILEPHIK